MFYAFWDVVFVGSQNYVSECCIVVVLCVWILVGTGVQFGMFSVFDIANVSCTSVMSGCVVYACCLSSFFLFGLLLVLHESCVCYQVVAWYTFTSRNLMILHIPVTGLCSTPQHLLGNKKLCQPCRKLSMVIHKTVDGAVSLLSVFLLIRCKRLKDI